MPILTMGEAIFLALKTLWAMRKSIFGMREIKYNQLLMQWERKLYMIMMLMEIL